MNIVSRDSSECIYGVCTVRIQIRFPLRKYFTNTIQVTQVNMFDCQNIIIMSDRYKTRSQIK